MRWLRFGSLTILLLCYLTTALLLFSARIHCSRAALSMTWLCNPLGPHAKTPRTSPAVPTVAKTHNRGMAEPASACTQSAQLKA